MARPWRIQFEDAIYHITVRGNNRQDIFLDDADRTFFLDLLKRVSHRFGLEIFAFCLMGNHFHLFLRTPEGNLSQAMHWLVGTYAGYFNWKNRRSGHLFQDRYKSVLVTEDNHWLHLSMYLHLNPVRAGLVERLADYRWSSYLDYIRAQSRFDWLQREEILAHYGSRSSCHWHYAQECLGFVGEKPDFIEQLKNGIIIGSRQTLEALTKKYRPAGRTKAVPAFLKASRKKISPQEEIARIAKIFKVKIEDLKHRRRNFPPRLVAYYHLVENCGLSVTETARVMGVSLTAVSLGINEVRKRMRKDRGLTRRIRLLTLN